MRFERAFVDWLSIREPNEGQFEPLNDGYVISIDSDGVERFTTSKSLDVEGSFSSCCRVRVTDREREISFNPSRWNRADNLFGLRFEQAVERANDVLASFGQPPLAAGECVQLSDGSFGYTGAIVTRVDVTANILTGNAPSLADYFWHVTGLKFDRVETRRKRNTVYFGSDSRKRIVKMYLKHVELRSNNSADPEYVRAVAEWCESVGLARLEVRYGRDWLRLNGLRALGNISHVALVEQFEKDVSPMLQEFDELNLDALTTLQKGIFAMYLNGFDIREEVSKSAFYRHRKAIKAATGYDINNRNVSRLEAKPRKIVLREAEPPEWYRMPEEA